MSFVWDNLVDYSNYLLVLNRKYRIPIGVKELRLSRESCYISESKRNKPTSEFVHMTERRSGQSLLPSEKHINTHKYCSAKTETFR
jgi:hypothetical protein